MSYVDVQRGTDFEHMASGLHPQQPPMTSPMGDSQGPAVCLGYGQILVLK